MGVPPRATRQCTAIRAELPQRPTLLLLSSACPPFSALCQTLPFYTPWSNTVLFIALLHPSHNHFQNVAVFTLQYVRPGSALYVGVEVYYSAQVRHNPPTSMSVYTETFSFMFRLKGLSVFVTQASFKPWILLLCLCT